MGGYMQSPTSKKPEKEMKAGGKYDPWYKTHEDYRSLVYFWRCETYDSLLYHFKLIKGNV